MDTQVKLLLAALALRLLGGICKAAGRSLWMKGLGWFVSAVGVWVAAGGAGAWFPIWPVVIHASAGWYLDLRVRYRRIATGMDFVLLAVIGLFSVPPMDWTRLVVLMAGFGGGGIAVDQFARWIPTRVRAAFVAASGLAALLGLWFGGQFVAQPILRARDGNVAARSGLFFIGLTEQSLHLGERQVLSTGAVAWLARSAAGGPQPGALVFHGADPAGARQRAAEVLRRALLDAGFTVLLVEHPGYGESPAPGIDDADEAWDPLPTGEAALEFLKSLPQVTCVYLVGHSMGTVDVIRLLGRNPPVEAAILFGAGMHESPEHLSDYWYERFHKDRRLSYRLPRSEVVEVQRLYYDDRTLLALLAADHPPVLFARFEYEWGNISTTRDAVYDLLPGSKRIWEVSNSSHYFSVFSRSGLLVGDTRIARALARQFRDLRAHVPELFPGGLADAHAAPD